MQWSMKMIATRCWDVAVESKLKIVIILRTCWNMIYIQVSCQLSCIITYGNHMCQQRSPQNDCTEFLCPFRKWMELCRYDYSYYEWYSHEINFMLRICTFLAWNIVVSNCKTTKVLRWIYETKHYNICINKDHGGSSFLHSFDQN